MDVYIDTVSAELREIQMQRNLLDTSTSTEYELQTVDMKLDGIPMQHAFPMQAKVGLNIGPFLCFVCGIGLGAAWIACSTSVVLFAAAAGKQVSIEMQFLYNIPILPLVLGVRFIEPKATKIMGIRLFVLLFSIFSFTGNAVICLLWDSFVINRTHLNLISAAIGVFSASGYTLFMLVVGDFPNAHNTAFRHGFMFSGVVNLVILQLTAFSTDRQVASSELGYWSSVGVVVLLGLVSAAILISLKDINEIFAKRNAASRVPPPAPTVSMGAAAKKVFPISLAIILSFCSGMLVYVYFPLVPSKDKWLPMILVYINIYSDVIGQKIAEFSINGWLPNMFSSQVSVLLLALVRCGMVVVFFFYLNGNILIADQWVGVYISAFVILGGVCCISAYHIGCNCGASMEERKAIATILSTCIFFGVYVAFAAAYTLWRLYFSTFTPTVNNSGYGSPASSSSPSNPYP